MKLRNHAYASVLVFIVLMAMSLAASAVFDSVIPVILCFWAGPVVSMLLACGLYADGWEFNTYEAIGSPDVYLRRWCIVKGPLFSIRIHQFLRDDHDVFHDHPWSFVTLILKGGYWEDRRYGDLFQPCEYGMDSPGCGCAQCAAWNARSDEIVSKWYGPGSIRFVRAETRHRVKLAETECLYCQDFRENPVFHTAEDCRRPIPCWTLVVTGPSIRKTGCGE